MKPHHHDHSRSPSITSSSSSRLMAASTPPRTIRGAFPVFDAITEREAKEAEARRAAARYLEDASKEARRIASSISQDIKLMRAERANNESFQFVVRGTQGIDYAVEVSTLQSRCTCPDFVETNKGRILCKHLAFVLGVVCRLEQRDFGSVRGVSKGVIEMMAMELSRDRQDIGERDEALSAYHEEQNQPRSEDARQHPNRHGNDEPRSTCASCRQSLPLSLFSKNQLSRHAGAKCKECVAHSLLMLELATKGKTTTEIKMPKSRGLLSVTSSKQAMMAHYPIHTATEKAPVVIASSSPPLPDAVSSNSAPAAPSPPPPPPTTTETKPPVDINSSLRPKPGVTPLFSTAVGRRATKPLLSIAKPEARPQPVKNVTTSSSATTTNAPPSPARPMSRNSVDDNITQQPSNEDATRITSPDLGSIPHWPESCERWVRNSLAPEIARGDKERQGYLFFFLYHCMRDVLTQYGNLFKYNWDELPLMTIMQTSPLTVLSTKNINWDALAHDVVNMQPTTRDVVPHVPNALTQQNLSRLLCISRSSAKKLLVKLLEFGTDSEMALQTLAMNVQVDPTTLLPVPTEPLRVAGVSDVHIRYIWRFGQKLRGVVQVEDNHTTDMKCKNLIRAFEHTRAELFEFKKSQEEYQLELQTGLLMNISNLESIMANARELIGEMKNMMIPSLSMNEDNNKPAQKPKEERKHKGKGDDKKSKSPSSSKKRVKVNEEGTSHVEKKRKL